MDRLQDHLQPFPIFLNARNINGDLKDQIERDTREHGTVYTQRILVIIDALDETGRHTGEDRPAWRNTEIEPTRVWQWATTKDELSQSLSKELKGYRFALDSTQGIHELTAAFVKTIPKALLSTADPPKIDELIGLINQWTTKPGGSLDDVVFLGPKGYTVNHLRQAHTMLSHLRSAGYQTISDPWPGPDKPTPTGVPQIWWDEIYTHQQLLARATAIFDGALRIYNDIVDRPMVYNLRQETPDELQASCKDPGSIGSRGQSQKT